MENPISAKRITKAGKIVKNPPKDLPKLTIVAAVIP